MTNLSKQKREVLEAKIELLRGKIDAADTEAQNALLSLEAELKHKKYGLVWEEHEEEIDRRGSASESITSQAESELIAILELIMKLPSLLNRMPYLKFSWMLYRKAI